MIYEIDIPSSPEQIQRVERLTEKYGKLCKFDRDELDSLAIAVTEIVANAIFHGNKRDKNKKIFIKIVATCPKLKITIRDQGKGFDPEQLSDPLKPENLLKDSGRGLFIVRTFMDDVRINFHDDGTEIIMVKTHREHR